MTSIDTVTQKTDDKMRNIFYSALKYTDICIINEEEL